MIKRFFSSMKSKVPISVTNNAWDKMAEIIKKKDAASFIFSAVSGGCNGFNYDLKLLNKDKYREMCETYTNKGRIKPTIIEKNNAKIFIDPLSEMHLIGTTIDYITEDYDKGIFENKFIFVADKNLASSCGCGISFTPKQ